MSPFSESPMSFITYESPISICPGSRFYSPTPSYTSADSPEVPSITMVSRSSEALPCPAPTAQTPLTSPTPSRLVNVTASWWSCNKERYPSPLPDIYISPSAQNRPITPDTAAFEASYCDHQRVVFDPNFFQCNTQAICVDKTSDIPIAEPPTVHQPLTAGWLAAGLFGHIDGVPPAVLPGGFQGPLIPLIPVPEEEQPRLAELLGFDLLQGLYGPTRECSICPVAINTVCESEYKRGSENGRLIGCKVATEIKYEVYDCEDEVLQSASSVAQTIGPIFHGNRVPTDYAQLENVRSFGKRMLNERYGDEEGPAPISNLFSRFEKVF